MAEVICGETYDFIAVAPDYTSGQYVIHYQSRTVMKIPRELIVSATGHCADSKFCKTKTTVFKKIQYVLR
jgi:hypothetical protein